MARFIRLPDFLEKYGLAYLITLFYYFIFVEKPDPVYLNTPFPSRTWG